MTHSVSMIADTTCKACTLLQAHTEAPHQRPHLTPPCPHTRRDSQTAMHSHPHTHPHPHILTHPPHPHRTHPPTRPQSHTPPAFLVLIAQSEPPDISAQGQAGVPQRCCSDTIDLTALQEHPRAPTRPGRAYAVSMSFVCCRHSHAGGTRFEADYSRVLACLVPIAPWGMSSLNTYASWQVTDA